MKIMPVSIVSQCVNGKAVSLDASTTLWHLFHACMASPDVQIHYTIIAVPSGRWRSNPKKCPMEPQTSALMILMARRNAFIAINTLLLPFLLAEQLQVLLLLLLPLLQSPQLRRRVIKRSVIHLSGAQS